MWNEKFMFFIALNKLHSLGLCHDANFDYEGGTEISKRRPGNFF